MPFDEAQLEITGDEEAQGFINNNPAKNSPGANANKSSGGANRRNGNGPRKQQQQQRRPSTSSGGRKSSTGAASNRRPSNGSKKGNASNCPGGSIEACIETCVPLEQVSVYGVCATECGKRCPE